MNSINEMPPQSHRGTENTIFDVNQVREMYSANSSRPQFFAVAICVLSLCLCVSVVRCLG
jgi:hypothetical protein